MKCAKSRNVKNCLSSSRSLGTPASGWRAASSETIRGDADPTWCTCSSALGRPAMKDWRLTPGSVSAGGPDHRSAMSAIVRPSPSTCSPSTNTDGVELMPALDAASPAASTQPSKAMSSMPGRTSASVAPASTARSTRSSSLGNGPSSDGWLSKSRSWNVLATSGPAASSTTANALADSRRVVVDPLEERQRAVLDADLAGLDRGVELVAHGGLELAAERAEEVLVDDDLLGRVRLADDAGRSCRWRPAGGVSGLSEPRLVTRK